MEPSFWLERWAKNEIGFHQATVNPYLPIYWQSLPLARNATVFVPLCGKSMDMCWLRERGHRVIGVELSQTAVEAFFTALQLAPRVSKHGSLERWEAEGYTLFCGDFFALTAADLTDVAAVFDRASLVALPRETRDRYVQKMRDILPPEVVTLLVAVTYLQHEMRGPPFSLSETEVRERYACYSIVKLADADILQLEENARFRQRGMTQMTEQVYRITTQSQ